MKLGTLLVFMMVWWGLLAQASPYLKPTTDHCTLPLEKQPLEQVLPCYLQQPDDAFDYKLEQTSEVSDKNLWIYSFTLFSQHWEPGGAGSVDHSIWQHRVTVYVPKAVKNSTALLYINGGTLYPEPEPSEPDQQEIDFARIASETNSIVVDLKDVPNQSLSFSGEGTFKEDDLIAHTWKKFLKDTTQNRHWLLRLPMVKSAVRTMDMVQEFMKKKNTEVSGFVVSGGSKRGWTAWLTSAMDSRVTMVAPMVIDILNLRPNMKHHENAYGYWAPAINRSYKDLKDDINSEEMSKLLTIIDPYSYLKFLNIPKYIISASADDFFLPDSTQFYFDDLPSNKWLRMLPNERHYIVRSNASLVTDTLLSIYGAHLNERIIPEVSWQLSGNTVSVSTEEKPLNATVWQANNPQRRDFRVTKDNPGVKQFTAEDIRLSCSHVCDFKLEMKMPETGWNAYFIQFNYANDNLPDLVLTTPVFIYPDSYPDFVK